MRFSALERGGFTAAHYAAWTLLLLKALHKAGVTPCSNKLLHRVLFLGNSLAKLYRYSPPQELVQQHPRGPFYPRAQFELDRLCIFGLATVSNVAFEQLPAATRWDKRVLVDRTGVYEITPKGFDVARELEQCIAWAQGCSDFLLDLALAFAALPEKHALSLEKVDPNYSQGAGGDPYRVTNFSAYHDNLTLRTLDELRSYVPSFATPSAPHSLRLFTEYLDSLSS